MTKYDYSNEEDEQYLPLRETVYNRLRKQILTGELKPGERLMEIHLAEKMDVSRTPVREAIRKLELEGLVKIIPRSGAQVAQISEKELRDVLEVRRTLDGLSSELASMRITAPEKAKLTKACEYFEAAVAGGDSVEIAKADVEFHDIINEAARNSCLLDISKRLADQIYRYRFEYIKDENNYSQLIKEHRDLTKAILAGDSDRASKIAKEHIDRQQAAILAGLTRKK